MSTKRIRRLLATANPDSPIAVTVSKKAPRYARRGRGGARVSIPPRRMLAPPGTRGFYGLNQGAHGVELKDIDTAVANYEFSTTGTITLINGVAQGTDFTNRVGRKFDMKSILIRGHAIVGATPTAEVCRWLLVYDKQANSAAPVITDILTGSNTAGLNNLVNRDRFIIVADKTLYLEATGAAIKPVKRYIRCNLECTNSGTGATIGSIATGSLWLVTVGSTATGVTSGILTVTLRVRFTDS